MTTNDQITKIANQIYPITGKSSRHLNAVLIEDIQAITAQPIQLLKKLLDCNVPNESNQHVFDEVNKFLKENE